MTMVCSHSLGLALDLTIGVGRKKEESAGTLGQEDDTSVTTNTYIFLTVTVEILIFKKILYNIYLA